MSYYFTGDEAAAMEQTVKGLLKTYLDGLLNGGDNASKFAAWNGVRVIWSEDIRDGNRSPRELWVILKIETVATERAGAESIQGDRQVWTIEADCHASEYTGAGVGTSGTRIVDGGTTTVLGNAMRNGINQQSGYIALREMKLMQSSCRADTQQSPADGVERINPHKIEFATLAIPA